MPITTAVIQVVGIFLVSSHIVPGGFVAVAPRIPCSTSGRPAIKRNVELSDLSAEEAMKAKGLEEHVAILLIPRDDYISSGEWRPQAFDKNYLYVRFDGEQIRFIPSPIRETRQAHGELKRQRSNDELPIASDDLGLLRPPCCALRPEYLPPDYRLAAAVLDLSNGRVKACTQGFLRQDTVVEIDNSGTLTIEATKRDGKGETKKLMTVKGGARLTFENAPASRYPGMRGCGGGDDHVLAYSAMVDPNQPIVCPARTRGGPPLCTPNSLVVVVAHVHQGPPDFITNALCSNNQWP